MYLDTLTDLAGPSQESEPLERQNEELVRRSSTQKIFSAELDT